MRILVSILVLHFVNASQFFKPKEKFDSGGRKHSLKTCCIQKYPADLLFNEDIRSLMPSFKIQKMHQAAIVLGLLLYEALSDQIHLITQSNATTIMVKTVDTSKIKKIHITAKREPYLQKILELCYHHTLCLKTSIGEIINHGESLFSCIIGSPYSLVLNVYFDLAINVFLLQCILRGRLKLETLYYAKVLTLATVPDIEHLLGDQLWNLIILIANQKFWQDQLDYEYRIPSMLSSFVNNAVDHQEP
jgi:hypothetical protein